MRNAFAATLLLLMLASPGSAQVAWDGPSLIGPASPLGLAVFLVNPEPGNGLAALASWRRNKGTVTLGYRGLVGEGADGDLALGAGLDVSGVLSRGMEDSDVDLMWWTGLGAGVGDDVTVSVPIGIVAGWTGFGDGVVFSPYAGGHVALDFTSLEGDAVQLDGSLDLGVDLVLVSGWIVRFGASLGGRDALAVGIRMPSGARSQN